VTVHNFLVLLFGIFIKISFRKSGTLRKGDYTWNDSLINMLS